MSRLFWKALLAFLVLPGTVAFVVPLTIFLPRRQAQVPLWFIAFRTTKREVTP